MTWKTAAAVIGVVLVMGWFPVLGLPGKFVIGICSRAWKFLLRWPSIPDPGPDAAWLAALATTFLWPPIFLAAKFFSGRRRKSFFSRVVLWFILPAAWAMALTYVVYFGDSAGQMNARYRPTPLERRAWGKVDIFLVERRVYGGSPTARTGFFLLIRTKDSYRTCVNEDPKFTSSPAMGQGILRVALERITVGGCRRGQESSSESHPFIEVEAGDLRRPALFAVSQGSQTARFSLHSAGDEYRIEIQEPAFVDIPVPRGVSLTRSLARVQGDAESFMWTRAAYLRQMDKGWLSRLPDKVALADHKTWGAMKRSGQVPWLSWNKEVTVAWIGLPFEPEKFGRGDRFDALVPYEGELAALKAEWKAAVEAEIDRPELGASFRKAQKLDAPGAADRILKKTSFAELRARQK